ncbi:hypothetical protein DSO57_1029798 [Entomophthora muscae]|uniref:Uncharacterized protein n=1 Tax=Entomophthora muscae TaxID=34485 RepID=A0ACC2T0Z5_9FUNG|nr:hypothetical protein DSO57_1029798 [Entomophthora muscae]
MISALRERVVCLVVLTVVGFLCILLSFQEYVLEVLAATHVKLTSNVCEEAIVEVQLWSSFIKVDGFGSSIMYVFIGCDVLVATNFIDLSVNVSYGTQGALDIPPLDVSNFMN